MTYLICGRLVSPAPSILLGSRNAVLGGGGIYSDAESRKVVSAAVGATIGARALG